MCYGYLFFQPVSVSFHFLSECPTNQKSDSSTTLWSEMWFSSGQWGYELVYSLSSVCVCEMKQAGCDVLLAGGLVLVCKKAGCMCMPVSKSLSSCLFPPFPLALLPAYGSKMGIHRARIRTHWHINQRAWCKTGHTDLFLHCGQRFLFVCLQTLAQLHRPFMWVRW